MSPLHLETSAFPVQVGHAFLLLNWKTRGGLSQISWFCQIYLSWQLAIVCNLMSALGLFLCMMVALLIFKGKQDKEWVFTCDFERIHMVMGDTGSSTDTYQAAAVAQRWLSSSCRVNRAAWPLTHGADTSEQDSRVFFGQTQPSWWLAWSKMTGRQLGLAWFRG